MNTEQTYQQSPPKAEVARSNRAGFTNLFDYADLI